MKSGGLPNSNETVLFDVLDKHDFTHDPSPENTALFMPALELEANDCMYELALPLRRFVPVFTPFQHPRWAKQVAARHAGEDSWKTSSCSFKCRLAVPQGGAARLCVARSAN